jgi:hypothetical protein
MVGVGTLQSYQIENVRVVMGDGILELSLEDIIGSTKDVSPKGKH